MKTTIAHIIQTAEFPSGSELHIAQPVTLASMVVAQAFSSDGVDVELIAVNLREECPEIPAEFTILPSLQRTVCEVAEFHVKRPLPMIDDILQRVAEYSSAEYLIYSNIDIAVQPHFYETVASLIRQGYDAFVINRRTIGASYTSPSELPMMYADVGEAHPGFDCFVFRRDAYPNYRLGGVCIGTGWICRALTTNLICCATRFEEFRDLHVTFHIGNARAWRRPEYEDYFRYNLDAFRRTVAHFKDIGQLTSHPLIDLFVASAEKELLVQGEMSALRETWVSGPDGDSRPVLFIQAGSSDASFACLLWQALVGSEQSAAVIVNERDTIARTEIARRPGVTVSERSVGTFLRAIWDTWHGRYVVVIYICKKRRKLRPKERLAAFLMTKRVRVFEHDPDGTSS
jgi:hypothetical protein